MIYKFNKCSLTYQKVTGKIGLIVVVSTIGLTTLFSIYTLRRVNDIRYISEETKAIILSEQNEFSRDKLKEYILQLNIKYPHIVMAQAEIETGYFSSKIFKENNNIFGMKQARQRPTTSLGTDNNHAYFENWKSSVIDYALFQAAYLKDIDSEEEYFQYLKANYAQDSSYVDKLKEIIEQNNKLDN